MSEFIRCKVADTSTGDIPPKNNALFLGVDGVCGQVLIDGETKVTTYNLGWIHFDANAYVDEDEFEFCPEYGGNVTLNKEGKWECDTCDFIREDSGRRLKPVDPIDNGQF
jgi:hypothetical protein